MTLKNRKVTIRIEESLYNEIKNVADNSDEKIGTLIRKILKKEFKNIN
jgi:hypothetical protein